MLRAGKAGAAARSVLHPAPIAIAGGYAYARYKVAPTPATTAAAGSRSAHGRATRALAEAGAAASVERGLLNLLQPNQRLQRRANRG